jgi:hypothetical protein
MSTWVIVLLAVVISAGVVLVIAVAGGRAGRNRGYEGKGGDTIVRCSRGHLFTTVWIVGASFKAAGSATSATSVVRSARSGAS